jgi:exonuclease VII large subunit
VTQAEIAEISEKIVKTIEEDVAPIREELETVETRLEATHPATQADISELSEKFAQAISEDIEEIKTEIDKVDSYLEVATLSQKARGYAYLYLLNQVQTLVSNFKDELDEITENEPRLLRLNEVEKALEFRRSELKALLEGDASLKNNADLKAELYQVANPLENANLDTLERHLAAIQKSFDGIATNFGIEL